MEKAHKRRHHRLSRTTDIPCAMVYDLFRALPGVRDLVVTVACRSSPANLAPAQGCQDHTTSPSAVIITRQSICCVHRIPSRVRDDASAPRAESGRFQVAHFLKKRKKKSRLQLRRSDSI